MTSSCEPDSGILPDSKSTPILPYIRQPVEFQEYDPLAPEAAQYVINLIQAHIPNVTVEHIGSTAVPGCAGRGVIDLMILYRNEPVEPLLTQLDALGFQWVQRSNDLPDEWPKGAGAVLFHERLFRLHIHVQPDDHPSVIEKRIFRDRLRSEPGLRNKYMAHKQALIENGNVDPIQYTSAKAGFVLQILDDSIMKILETDRLILRRLLPEDFDALFVLYSDPEIRRYFPEGTLTYEETKEELEWFLNGHPERPELGLWATVYKETGQFIGRCGLLPWTIDGQDEVEIAYMIAKEFQGRGLATEAAGAILQYGFDKLGLSRLICLMDPKNIASQKVAQRIGMSLEREVDGIAGDNFPTLIYSIHEVKS